jgi:uncharacterized protein YbaP (TraB family)
VACALALLVGCATGPARHGAPAERPVVADGPLLWHAVAPGPGGGELFLFGSVHVGTPDDLELGPAVESAWEGADELVVEVDLSQLSLEDVSRKTLAWMRLPPGETLRDRVSPAVWEQLEEALGGPGSPELARVARLKPWAATTYLAMRQFAEAGLDEQYGVDKQFLGRAAGSLPIYGLETLESQLRVLDGLDEQTQELMLRDTLTRLDEDPSLLLDAWRHGDEAALAEIVFHPLDEFPEYAAFYDALFFERNEAMAAKLAARSRDGRRRFVVVGTGHLVGPRGIPALLSARGWRVEVVSGRPR